MSAWKKWKRRSRYRAAYDDDEPKAPVVTPGLYLRDWQMRFRPWIWEWLHPYEERIPADRLQLGKSCVVSGLVRSLDINPGKVLATVRGYDWKEHGIEVRFRQFTDREWEEVFRIVNSQAIHPTQVLAGSLSDDLIAKFGEANLSLYPRDQEDFLVRCNCPEPEFPCYHIPAVYYLIADRMTTDPFLVFLLRGRDKESFLETVRAGIGEWDPIPESADSGSLPATNPVSVLSTRMASYFAGDIDAIPAGLPGGAKEPAYLSRYGQAPLNTNKTIVAVLRSAAYAAREKIEAARVEDPAESP